MSLADTFGRTIQYLRLSVTAACPMRCMYCRPSAIAYQRESELTNQELVSLVRHLVDRHGLQKVRLTGGEPTARPDLLDLIRQLKNIPGLHELAMTTNGLTLAQQANAFADAGLDRVNISLDSLNSECFARMTGIDGLARVQRGVEAARTAGLTPVKLNAVVIRNQNDSEIPELVRYAAQARAEIRFIELMPMGPLADSWTDRFVSATQMREQLANCVTRWTPLAGSLGPAQRYHAELSSGETVTIGFIPAMSCNFCDSCNRMRIASDGAFYPCLMDEPGGSLIPCLRPTFDPDGLDALLRAGLAQKRDVHPAQGVGVMLTIGG